MSAEEAVTEGLQQPIEQNAAARADAEKMLAELEAQGTSAAKVSSKPESNGASNGNKEEPTAESENKDEAKAEDKEAYEGRDKDRDFRHPDRRDDRDRDDRNRDRKRDSNHRGGRGGRGGGRGGFQKQHRDNIKSVLTLEEKSSDPVAIRKQVEFYFSDSNLPMDQFLFDKVGGSENNPVDLDIIRSFKRMRHFEPLEAIVAALKDAKTVRLVDNDTKVQRKQPLPKTTDHGVEGKTGNRDAVRVFEDKAMPRSVYVKGFGQEVPSTQFDIEAWFAQYGSTNAIRLRRADDKVFKGSVFAEFETEELAKKFLELDPKPTYKDRELQIMSKKEYCEKKVQDIKDGKIQPGVDRSSRGSFRGRGGKSDDRRRRDDREDDRDWRTRRDEDRKNGFRDDKRRDNRDSRDKRGGRERRRSIEKDDRGIPVVKTDDAKSAAIAQAKAAVDAEQKKEEANGGAEVAEPVAEAQAEDVTAVEAGKKRERDEEGGAPEEPATKKVDVKADA